MVPTRSGLGYPNTVYDIFNVQHGFRLVFPKIFSKEKVKCADI
jgi:hypothetical protein